MYALTLEFLSEAAGESIRSRKPGSAGDRFCFDFGHLMVCFWMKFESDQGQFRGDLQGLAGLGQGLG